MNSIKTEQSAIYRIYCAEEQPGPCGMVIFGASGDLTMRKLIPSLFSLFLKQFLPDRFFLLGFARTKMDNSAFRQVIQQELDKIAPAQAGKITEFTRLCHYLPGDYQKLEDYRELQVKLKDLTADHGTEDKLLFYLSVPPMLYHNILDHLFSIELIQEKSTAKQWRRVVFEKPFGRDLQSSRELEGVLAKTLGEHQIYRIDHYLGKETVQNIMMLRFANAVFEPLWNRRYVDHVQITVAEDIGIGHRAGYYDKALGARTSRRVICLQCRGRPSSLLVFPGVLGNPRAFGSRREDSGIIE